MRASQKGFTVVEVILALAVVGLLALSGWLFYDRQKASTNNQATPEASQNPANQTTESELVTYQEPVAKVEYQYPKNWTLKTDKSPYGEGDLEISTTTITSPNGNVLTINANYGGKGGMCEPAEQDTPHSPSNACATRELFTKDKIDLVSLASSYEQQTFPVYLVTGKYTSGTSKFFITLDNDRYVVSKPNEPVMGFWMPEGTSTFVGNQSKSAESDLYLDVYAISDSETFLTSQEGEQIKQILRSFKNT